MEISFDRGTLLVSSLDSEHTRLTRGVQSPARKGAAATPQLCFPAYVQWDPRVRRFRAPAFRLRELTRWLDARGVAWSRRSNRPPTFKLATSQNAHDVTLRYYQEEALKAWEAAERRGQICLPTGSGKTRLAVHAILSLGHPAIVLVPTRQLLWQWRQALQQIYPGPTGVHGDGEHSLEPITVATYESAHRYMDRFGDHFELLVLDEAHHVASREVREACQMATAPARLGLTATPPRDPQAFRAGAEVLGPFCFSIPLLRLSGRELADFEIVVLPLGFTPSEKEEYLRCRRKFLARLHSFFEENPGASWAELARSSSATAEGREAMAAYRRSQEIVALPRAKVSAIDCLLETHHGDQKVIFTRDNRSAYEISRQFLVPAVTCEICRKEREQILERFRAGLYSTIVSARVLNEGLDVPEASVAVIAGGSGSSREYAQRIGRVLRPRPGKKAMVFELVIVGTSEWKTSEWRGRDALDGTPPP